MNYTIFKRKLRHRRTFRLIAHSILFSAVVIGAATYGLRSSRAQSSGGGANPDYSKVNDFLNGTNHLLQNDDVIVSLDTQTVDNEYEGFYLPYYTSDSTATGLFPSDDPNPEAYFTYLGKGEAVGRFFNTAIDTMVRYPDKIEEDSPAVLSALYYGAQGNKVYLSKNQVDFITGGILFISRVGDFNGDGFDDVLMAYCNPNTSPANAKMRIATAVDVNNPGQGFRFGPEFVFSNP